MCLTSWDQQKITSTMWREDPIMPKFPIMCVIVKLIEDVIPISHTLGSSFQQMIQILQNFWLLNGWSSWTKIWFLSLFISSWHVGLSGSHYLQRSSLNSGCVIASPSWNYTNREIRIVQICLCTYKVQNTEWRLYCHCITIHSYHVHQRIHDSCLILSCFIA